jgi:hypothetical protein
MCFACSPFAGAFANAMSRRALLKHGVAWAGMAGAATRAFVCSPAEAANESVDTLYVGGPIVTINDLQPTAEAVLVRGGKIVAVGARAEVEKQAQGPIATVDLKGKTLLPGLRRSARPCRHGRAPGACGEPLAGARRRRQRHPGAATHSA